MKPEARKNLDAVLKWVITLVRIAIGWHFLYEGISKIIITEWSSAPYLQDQDGSFPRCFRLWQKTVLLYRL